MSPALILPQMSEFDYFVLSFVHSPAYDETEIDMGIMLLLPPIIISLGIYLIISLKGGFWRHPILAVRDIVSECKKPKALSSLFLALAGTLGVGNIVGVAVSLSIGGAGSLFWMFISGLFSSYIKYAEVTLATDSGCGGMADALNGTMPRYGKSLAYLYTFLTLLLSLSMGGALQADSILSSGAEAFEIPEYYIIIPVMLIILFIAYGGADKISSCINIIIPMTTIVYVILCLSVIFINISDLSYVISDIIKSAFNFKSPLGGFIGFLCSSAVRCGFSTGILSNEAGAGTSSLSHARADSSAPHCRGLFGVLEVVFDTLLLCPLTGLAVLMSGVDITGGGAGVIINCFSTLHPTAPTVLFVLIFFFATATILCWYYYGEYSWKSLFPKIPRKVYLLIFILTVSLSAFIKTDFLVSLSDTILLVMSFITISYILYKRKRLLLLSKRYM